MRRRSAIMSVVLTLLLPVAAHCASIPAAQTKQADKAKMGHSMNMGGGAAAAEGPEMAPSGKVVETMNGGDYSYAKLEKNGKAVWIAFPAQETRVGDTLTFGGCIEMDDFQSKSLNRKFDLILFCGAPQNKAQATPAAVKKSPDAEKDVKSASPKLNIGKASGANAYTIEQLYAKSAGLDGKPVAVKGQVVKVSKAIMGKNWIHLQDGSGNEKDKTDDVVVTSTDQPKIGDVVTASGTLAKDKDFGGGYKYSVIIEKVSLKK